MKPGGQAPGTDSRAPTPSAGVRPFKVAAVALVAALAVVRAGESEAASQRSASEYGKGTGDSVRVVPLKSGDVRVELRLTYAGGHSCSAREIGRVSGAGIEVVADSLDESHPCHLFLQPTDSEVRLKDPGGYCAAVFCGTRGTLDGVRLPRRYPAR